ncbi:O-antigen ligase family protein [Marinomonas sp.]|uniref:O-antigen ligase family protein n=1 Tax=Marinomonas sp. TaxID=1904862 RepID=UPI003A95DB5E
MGINYKMKCSSSFIREIGLYLFHFILLLSIVFPVALQVEKFILLFLMVLLFLLYVFLERGKLPIKKEVFLFSFFYSLFGLAWSLYGEMSLNPGALKVVTVMVLYPLIFTAFSVFWQNNLILNVQRFFVFFSFSLSFSLLLYIFSASGFISNSYYFFMQGLYEVNSVFDKGDDYLFFTHPSVSSLLFFIPFLMVLSFLRKEGSFFLFICFFIMIALVVVTGRRAIFVSFAFSVLFFAFTYYFFYKTKYNKISSSKIYFSFIVSFFILGYFVFRFDDFNLQVYVNGILTIFDFTSDASNLERTHQFFSLLDGISKNPVFGSGAGAAANYSRSSDQPWAYELSYIALIFQYGFLGFFLYVIGVLYIFFRMLEIVKSKNAPNDLKIFISAFLCGLVSFLVANATNPYLGKFDYMWVIFVPVAIVNSYLIEKGK